MKDGDIYFWRWKDNRRHADGKPYGAYHCKSQKAIFENGALRDTYWCGLSGGRLNLDDVVVEFQGNVNEMTEICEPAYYLDKDVVDMRHPNSSTAKIYLKVGAVRDPDTMRELAAYQIERSESEIRYTQGLIEQLNEAITQIDAGELDKIHIPVCR